MISSKAYAVFPLPTFLDYNSYLLDIVDDCRSTLAKYTQRGWRTQDVLWEEDESLYPPIRKSRRIGDVYTWMIPFDPINVDKSTIPDINFEIAEFRMGISRDPTGMMLNTRLRQRSFRHIHYVLIIFILWRTVTSGATWFIDGQSH